MGRGDINVPEEIVVKKKWFQSWTLWTNIVGAVCLFLQTQFGFVVDPKIQGYILFILNVLLRFKTDSPII